MRDATFISPLDVEENCFRHSENSLQQPLRQKGDALLPAPFGGIRRAHPNKYELIAISPFRVNDTVLRNTTECRREVGTATSACLIACCNLINEC